MPCSSVTNITCGGNTETVRREMVVSSRVSSDASSSGVHSRMKTPNAVDFFLRVSVRNRCSLRAFPKRDRSALLYAPWGRGTSGGCVRRISPPGCSPSAPPRRGSGSCCLAPVGREGGRGQSSVRAIARRLVGTLSHLRSRGGGRRARDRARRGASTRVRGGRTDLYDDEGAPELIERETHLGERAGGDDRALEVRGALARSPTKKTF